jgi:hypothetical protein
LHRKASYIQQRVTIFSVVRGGQIGISKNCPTDGTATNGFEN